MLGLILGALAIGTFCSACVEIYNMFEKLPIGKRLYLN